MSSFRLCFFGAEDSLNSPVLQKSGVITFTQDDSLGYKGLQLCESKFGKDFYKKLTVDLNDVNEERAFLIYRYVPLEILKTINSNTIYILNTKLLAVNYIKQVLEAFGDKCVLLSELQIHGELRNPQDFDLNRLAIKNILVSSIKKNTASSESSSEFGYNFPIAVYRFIKILLSPFQELKKYGIFLKFLNLKWLVRVGEFFSMIYGISAIIYGYIVTSYYILAYLTNVTRNCLRDIYYRYLHKTYFQIYDYSCRAVAWAFRFTKLVLLRPFFKIYWIFSHEYEKRIKKTGK